MKHAGWRSSIGAEWQELRRGPQEPPHEPDGLCMAYQCPRTGTAVTDDLTLCGFHRGLESTRVRHKTPGPRSNDR